MPTSVEFEKLYNACGATYDRTKYATMKCGESTKFSRGAYLCGNYDGAVGVVFSDGGKKIFLPAAATGEGLSRKGSNICCYWSQSLTITGNPSNAKYLNFGGVISSPSSYSDFRYLGMPVRPVYD